MAEKRSISEARRDLSKLIREVETGKTVGLTRHGKPVAVLIGHRVFRRLVGKRRGFIAAYRDFTEAVDLAELALDPDALFEGVRDRTPGRVGHRPFRHG